MKRINFEINFTTKEVWSLYDKYEFQRSDCPWNLLFDIEQWQQYHLSVKFFSWQAWLNESENWLGKAILFSSSFQVWISQLVRST